MHLGTDRLKLIGQEPPARRCLQRDLEPLAAEALSEPRTRSRSAGAIRVRETSPVEVSIHSAVSCARC